MYNINQFKMKNPVAFSTFTMLCNHHLNLVPEYFYQPKRKSTSLSNCFLSHLPPQALTTTHLLSLDLPLLYMTDPWDLMLYSLWCLASWTQHHGFFCLSFFLFFGGVGLDLWHMEVPRLEITLELRLPSCTTTTATQDLSRVFDLHYSSQQRRFRSPLNEARDQTSWILVGFVTAEPKQELPASCL